jgi:thiamine biosynthesis protein ThiI
MTEAFCILIHYHEIALKGKNRSWFERRLVKNIKQQLHGLPFSKVQLNAARIFCFGIDESIWNDYAQRLKKVMGIKHAILMTQVKDDIDTIKSVAVAQLKGLEFSSFRVSARRQYKDFHLSSQEINIMVGQHLQSTYLKPVKLKNADMDVVIELVKGMAYIGHERIYGFGGLPVKTSEQAISMISSGIDSPVSSFEMLKRGVELTYVHFHSAPATSRQSIQNVEEILTVLAGFQIQCRVYMVPLLKIQQKIMTDAPNKLWVILFRRAMIKIASMIAEQLDIPALISGESVGQVASQTLSNIRATADAADRPILRPLAGLNKEDIIRIAEKIGTYEISIEPYDDCCSFFVPIHPETKADLEIVRKTEANIDFGEMFATALKDAEIKTFEHPDYVRKSINRLEKVSD